ncbi:MAG: IS5 family transposase [Solirubrobacterales bacterium]
MWNLPDELWERVEPILARHYPPAPTGRPRADLRLMLDGIIFRMRTGCQWNQMPERFGPDSTVHNWFQTFVRDGVLEEIWAQLVAECEQLGEVEWEWQAADGVMGKSRFCGDKRGPNPTDRAKSGTKKSLIVERTGGPLGAVIDGANVHDTKLLEATIEAIVIERPDPDELTQHLCLDKAYDNPTGEGACEAGAYAPHIRRIGEERLDEAGLKRHPARRWVVERTIAWLQKCRALLIRYDKKAENYLGLIQLACALLWSRRLHRVGWGRGVSG